MAKFWLATFERPLAAGLKAAPPKMAATEPSLSTAEPLVAAGDPAHAIEIIENKGDYAVLFSIIDNPVDPKTFLCKIGFANDSKSCAVWGDRGFPLVDAVIAKTKQGDLTISAPCFVGEGPAIQYEAKLVSILKLPKVGKARKSGALQETTYKQALRGPDVVSPGSQIAAKAVNWAPVSRMNITEWKNHQSTFQVNPSRYPTLKPFAHAPTPPTKIWSGNVELPRVWAPTFPPSKVVTLPRSETFGVAAFQFEDVEVLGFRLDLQELVKAGPRGVKDGLPKLIEELVAPLNFHLSDRAEYSAATRSAVSDFRFRAATYTVMVELLRYGKMKLKKATPPLTIGDFQSQHELVVRILVGRVDDDSAQARDPATFVPAIFVDNSWSKTLGRNVQGFDKRMAKFCVSEDGAQHPTALRPDGRLAKEKHPRPLGSISEIALATKAGEKNGHTLLKLECPYRTINDWNAFVKFDPRLALGPISIAPMSWRQTDFDSAEYRRSFARSVVRNTFREFSSIQVSPVGGENLRNALRKQTTWIKGTMKFGDNVQIVQPTGTVNLTFHADASAPPAWKTLTKLLGQSRIAMPTGTWYRMRCSMDLTINNSLD